MLILQHVLALADLPPHTPVLTLDGGPALAMPGSVHAGPALLLVNSRPRLRLEIGDLHSRENVRLALSTHLTLEIVDPLRFYLDFVRTPADYDEEQLAAVLSALIATALRPAMVSLSLGELNADPNLRAWLETTIRKGLSEIDLEGRSGLRVEELEAYDLRCDVWDERARARTARYLRNALAAATAPYALVDQAVLEALRDAVAPAPSPIAAPATRAAAGDADPLRTETLHSLLRNPPSHLRPELWRCSLHAGVNTQPACDDQRVYVATRTGEIYAFDLNHGNPAWPQSAQLGVAPGDGMLLAGDLLWIPAHDGVLYALRAATGMIAQRVAIGGRLSSAPLLVGDRLYVSVDVSPDRPDDKTTGQIVAVDPHRGHILGTWKVSRHGLRARPAPFQGALFVGDRQGAFYCLDVARHRVEPLPEVRIGRILSPAAVDARRSQLVVGGSYGVSAVEASGRVRWTAHPGGTAGGVAAQPLIWKDTVVVGAADGHLHTLRAGDGKAARSPFASGGPIATAPTPVRHLLVFGSNDGSLYALVQNQVTFSVTAR